MVAPHPETGAGSASLDPRSDRELMRAHHDGDTTAFPVLVARHRQRFWNLALRTLRDREEAADALQEGFIRAFRAAAGYRGEAEVASWLHRIVLNACLRRIERRHSHQTVTLDDAAPDSRNGEVAGSGRDAYAGVDARLDLTSMLTQLPDEQQRPLVLVHVDGLSVSEAAQVLGVAEGTVKSRCARGRARLAAILLAQNREPGDRHTGSAGGQHR